MAFLLCLLFFVEVIVALLMVAVVMLQPPKDQSGGMGSAFGGGFGEEVFGGRTGNVLSRTTVVLGVILIINSLAIAICLRGGLSERSLADRQVAPEAPAETAVPEVPAQ
ncbi:MAG: preprotein translocase subunit SecG [Kiritimatiellae bacterium]|nr:preprotein translocase subunit SecG [Kiritimatiellia bacterium]